jgi:iron complex transport system substrate-binding protein
MRVVSLVPAATEMISALGAEATLVGISHECDWPASVRALPRVTVTRIDSRMASGAIDAEVRRLQAEGHPVIAVDGALLRALRPDLIVTQDLCDVCAVMDGDVRSLATALDSPPALLPLRARTLAGIFADIHAVSAALALENRAEALVSDLKHRLRDLGAGRQPQLPRVVCIEWLDPVFLAGHWVPELISAAGGRDVGAEPGSHSRVIELEAVEALQPDVVIVAPCGFGIDHAESEFRNFEAGVEAQGGRPPSSWDVPVWLLDGNAYTSRPGPRVVDGAIRIAAALRGESLPGLRPASRQARLPA